MRWPAAHALGAIGPEAAAAIPALIEFLRVRGPGANSMPMLKPESGGSSAADVLAQIGKAAVPALLIHKPADIVRFGTSGNAEIRA